MTTIIDYNAGNIASVTAALQRLGEEWILTADPVMIKKAGKIIMPGVGDAGVVMASLRELGLEEVIRKHRKPVLGICVGMQIMCRHCEESDTQGLSIFDTVVKRFRPLNGEKVPHMGWNDISNLESKLFKDIPSKEYVYYVHSYRADLCTDTIATTRYCDEMFSAALKYENFYGTQFHPEKSGSIGERLLDNFLRL